MMKIFDQVPERSDFTVTVLKTRERLLKVMLSLDGDVETNYFSGSRDVSTSPGQDMENWITFCKEKFA